MSEFKLCSIEEAQQMIEQGNAVVADIRDAQSFADGHVENAFHLTNTSMGQFAKDVDFRHHSISDSAIMEIVAKVLLNT